jgi:hypothetical protein
MPVRRRSQGAELLGGGRAPIEHSQCRIDGGEVLGRVRRTEPPAGGAAPGSPAGPRCGAVPPGGRARSPTAGSPSSHVRPAPPPGHRARHRGSWPGSSWRRTSSGKRSRSCCRSDEQRDARSARRLRLLATAAGRRHRPRRPWPRTTPRWSGSALGASRRHPGAWAHRARCPSGRADRWWCAQLRGPRYRRGGSPRGRRRSAPDAIQATGSSRAGSCPQHTTDAVPGDRSRFHQHISV